jgi:pimeloyl-[acyl-carrier protein] methyl ester esterase
MLPGWGMDSSVWKPIIAFLAEYFEIIYCDWYGIEHIEDFKTRVLNLIEEEVEGNFCILGWSLGSLLAVEAACKYKNRIKWVILVSGTSRFSRDKQTGYSCGWPQSVVNKMKAALQKDRVRTMTSFYSSMFSVEETKQFCDKKFIDTMLMGRVQKTKELEAGLNFLLQEDVREMLASIDIPLLLIHGAKDTICPVSASEYISRQVKGKVLLNIMAGAGHVPFLTATNEFKALIKVFIEQGEKND